MKKLLEVVTMFVWLSLGILLIGLCSGCQELDGLELGDITGGIGGPVVEMYINVTEYPTGIESTAIAIDLDGWGHLESSMVVSDVGLYQFQNGFNNHIFGDTSYTVLFAPYSTAIYCVPVGGIYKPSTNESTVSGHTSDYFPVSGENHDGTITIDVACYQ